MTASFFSKLRNAETRTFRFPNTKKSKSSGYCLIPSVLPTVFISLHPAFWSWLSALILSSEDDFVHEGDGLWYCGHKTILEWNADKFREPKTPGARISEKNLCLHALFSRAGGQAVLRQAGTGRGSVGTRRGHPATEAYFWLSDTL